MRPINKGESPYKKINEYKDALPYLERRIGMYCSYCEFSIPHVPEVEHVVSKSKGGDLTDWNNLNLGCKYCNTRKKAQTMPENKKNYLWTDEDNTAIAYSYINGIPKVNEELLIKLDSTGDYLKRARNTYNLVGLGNLPMGKDRDRRFGQRNTAYQKALNSLEHWNHMKDLSKEYQNDMKNQIIMTALGDGFFSIWMEVFCDEPEIRLALIETFPGTNLNYCDEKGCVKEII